MKDVGSRQPGRSELRHTFPREAGLLTAPRERAPPQIRDVMMERLECPEIRGHSAYFRPSWTAFQADRGRHFSVIVDGVSD
jgi:hypothetical protein